MFRKLFVLCALLGALLLFAMPAAAARTRLDTPTLSHKSDTTFTWTAVSNASGYRIRWTARDGRKKSRKLSSSTTQYTIKPKQLMKDSAGAVMKHKVEVRALANSTSTRNSLWSNAVLLELSPTPAKFPLLNVVAFPNGDSFDIVWGAVTGAVDYQVRWKKPNGNTRTKKIAVNGAANQRYTIKAKQLKDGSTDNVKVRPRGDTILYEKQGEWSQAVLHN